MRDPLGHWHIVGARAPPLGAFAAWAEPNVTDRLQLVRGWWQHPGAGWTDRGSRPESARQEHRGISALKRCTALTRRCGQSSTLNARQIAALC